ncbi:MAG: HAD-IA family hydrolase [Paracoccus sp. (in: a-proteobacteria)]|uniref:HAD-IA family hydrolase n=1 Tax=Paracoccus sp. TaxID=267 RepID=UPI0026E0BCBF|nr:HAD-IA family hydrolase [Paracoccus sp. (in: a-proteobacteria)]MDO5622810.1 HAD-IA family hydrolase [Paracoccus sp. (in: a-proteobacteria)]
MSLRALIFDVDGTLAETEELHRRAFNDSFAAQGLGWHWSRDDYRGLLQVTGGKERIAHHLRLAGADPAGYDIAALHRDKTDRYTALMAQGEIALRDGIAALIDEAKAAGIKVAIATTTSRPNIDALIRATMGAEAVSIFDAIAAGDEVVAKKPAPDVYLLAMHRLGIPAGQAIALEDSLNGANSARAAGIACLVSPATYTQGDVFPKGTALVDSFADAGGVAGIAERLGMRL